MDKDTKNSPSDVLIRHYANALHKAADSLVGLSSNSPISSEIAVATSDQIDALSKTLRSGLDKIAWQKESEEKFALEHGQHEAKWRANHQSEIATRERNASDDRRKYECQAADRARLELEPRLKAAEERNLVLDRELRDREHEILALREARLELEMRQKAMTNEAKHRERERELEQQVAALKAKVAPPPGPIVGSKSARRPAPLPGGGPAKRYTADKVVPMPKKAPAKAKKKFDRPEPSVRSAGEKRPKKK